MKKKTNVPCRSGFTWILSLLLLAIRSQAQDLLSNGSFETPPVTNVTKVGAFDPEDLSPWQTTAAKFEVWTNGWTNPQTHIRPLNSADGGQNLEILSTTNHATIWQTVPTVPGTTYVLSFFHTPRPGFDSVLTVLADSKVVAIFHEDGKGMTNFDWEEFTTNIVATGNEMTLSFSDVSLHFGSAGTHIDGVVLTENRVVNGSFETPAVTNKTRVGFFDPETLSPWTTTATNFEVWTNGWSNPTAGIGPQNSADGRQNLEILSSTNRAVVAQMVPTVPGANYMFGFSHTPRPGTHSTLTVSIGSNVVAVLDEDGSTLTNFNWQSFGTNFIATDTETTLSFSNSSSTGSGAHIDRVLLAGDAGRVIQAQASAASRAALDLPPLILSGQMMSDGHFQCYWPTAPGRSYQVQYCDSLTGNWTNRGAPIDCTDTILCIEDAVPTGVSQRFYRVQLLP